MHTLASGWRRWTASRPFAPKRRLSGAFALVVNIVKMHENRRFSIPSEVDALTEILIVNRSPRLMSGIVKLVSAPSIMETDRTGKDSRRLVSAGIHAPTAYGGVKQYSLGMGSRIKRIVRAG